MSKKPAFIECDVCGCTVSTGFLFKTLVKPYAKIPFYKRIIVLDEWGWYDNGGRVNNPQYLCSDCYNKLIDILKKEQAEDD